MNRFIKILILSLGFLGFLQTETKASHIAAVDVYYEYLGPLEYRVHLVLYRDCTGIPLGATEFMTYESSCAAGGSFTVDTNGTNDPLNGTYVHQLCANQSSWCTGGPWPGYQYFHYAADVTLPVHCSDWRFKWTSCCRNAAVLNIPPNSTCVFATVNTLARPINNSVILSVQPIPYVCVNQAQLYLNGPIDPDLDSVVFQSVIPSNNATNPGCALSTYNAPYTLANPLPTLAPAGYTVDQTTGTAAFTPTATGAYVLAFTATEYDKVTGNMVGQMMRDVQINVVNCNSGPPTILQIANVQGAVVLNNNPLVMGVCPGTTMSFDATGTADSPQNIVRTYSNNNISCPGSSYTSNPPGGGNPVTGTFNWTPNAGQVGDHTLILTFTDSSCTVGQPIVLKSYKVVLIKVLQGVDVGPDIPFCLGGDSVILPALGPSNVTQWNWSEYGTTAPPHGMSNPNIQNPKVAPTRSTYYLLETDAFTGCKNKDSIWVYIDTSVTVDALVSPQVVCDPGLVDLDAIPYGPAPTYSCGQENIPCAGADVPYTVTSGGASVSGLNLFPNTPGAKTQWLLTAADMTTLGFTGPTRINSLDINVLSKASTSTFNMEINMGCTYANELTVFAPKTLLKQVYANDTYSTVVGINTFTFQNPFVWDGSSNVIIELCYYNGPGNAIGADVISATTTGVQYQCRTQGAMLGGCNIPDASGLTAAQNHTYRPDFGFSSCDVPATAWQFDWTGPFIMDSSIQKAKAYVQTDSTWFYVYTVGGNNCRVYDSVMVNMSVHDVHATPADTSICVGDQIQAYVYGYGNAPGESFQWFDPSGGTSGLSCTNCSNPVITPTQVGPNPYWVVRTDAYGCTDTAIVNVNVLNKPNVTITNGDTITIPYGVDVTLFATGADKYSWSPAWGMNNPNVSSPIIRPDKNTLYTVYGIDDNGCGNNDEIYVIIDFNNNLFVPNAFSPNSDGFNDIFRIENFGLQKIQEFRVYNRWGQEVFNAGDNRGWDGTFKGVKQDAGVYFYMIKVAYDNGEVKVYNGDVILMR